MAGEVAHDQSRQRDRQVLTDFVVDNDDLERLEALADQFNLFEAIGVTRRELAHSNVLALLFEPRQNHGLGDTFLRRFLQRVLVGNPGVAGPVGPVDLDVWSMMGVAVRREWQHIDLLLIDEAHRFVVCIENKIGSDEHSDQLGRYRRAVEDGFPGWTRLFLFLTPDGLAPSDAAYVPVDYGLVARTVEDVAAGRGPALDPAVQVMMVHYARLLRRHVVSDSEIADLCRRIYRKHRRALDLIYEHRPDMQAELAAFLVDLVVATPGLMADDSEKQYVRFALPEWDDPRIPRGRDWTSSERMLLFQFDNFPDRLALTLVVGPGEDADRQRLLARARSNVPPLGPAFEEAVWRRRHWTRIFQRAYLEAVDLEESALEDLKDRIRDRWTIFIGTELTAIRDLMLSASDESTT